MKLHLKNEILKLKDKLNVTIVAHFYQKDEIFEIADITGDSLELAKKAKDNKCKFIIFCGVSFMGQSVKILDSSKRVLMPKLAFCSMAEMITDYQFDNAITFLNENGIKTCDILPITYINSSAEVKAKVGKMNGYVCTSSNAKQIITKALKENKKILFVPDKCLGQNIAKNMNLQVSIIGDKSDLKKSDIICYDGFCSVHQLFTPEDINFYREKYPNILIASHPECSPEVCNLSDFVGSTSQIINYVKNLSIEQKIAIGTEYNLVNRLREKNIYVLSSTKPECPTMNETTLEDVYITLKSIDDGEPLNEIFLDPKIAKWAKVALDRMMAL